MDKISNRKTIDPEIGINELIDKHPELIDILQAEYGFHCVNCIFSEFDTLEEGAAIHGIEGQDFIEMIENLERIINEEEIDEIVITSDLSVYED